MDEVKKLNEGVVTALADTDLVMAADANGILRPISVANLLAAIRDNIKVGGRNLLQGSMKSMAANSGANYEFSDGVHSIIMRKGGTGIYKSAGKHPIRSYCVSVEMKADVPMDIRWYLANNEASGVSFSVTTDWKRYSAVLTPTSEDLLFRLTSHNFTDRYYARFPKIEEGNIPTGFSLAPEDVLSKSGGVKCYFLTTYAILQKGGLRNGRDKGDYQRLFEVNNVGRNACPWFLLRHRQHDDPRHISRCRRKSHRDIAGLRFKRSVDLRNAGSDSREKSTYYPTADLRQRQCSREDMAIRMERLETVDNMTRKGVAA